MPSPDHAATAEQLCADLERVTRERDEARLETSLQMQDKLDAQSLLANICQAIAIDRSDFDLDDTWKTVAQTILARLTEIVDTANRDSERAERAERERDSLMADSWRAYVESGADPDGKLEWHTTPAWAGKELVDAVKQLRADHDEAWDEAERAERQRDQAIEALLSDLSDNLQAHTPLEAALAAALARVKGDTP